MLMLTTKAHEYNHNANAKSNAGTLASVGTEAHTNTNTAITQNRAACIIITDCNDGIDSLLVSRVLILIMQQM